MELVPRITRAQSMDALSSMATIAGYKAVLLAANTLPRMFPMLNTAAGTVAAARVFIVGAGVAGLQAIASARRLGARVEAYDVRPAVKEQIQSLGARFVELPIEAGDAQDAGGYAKAQDEAFYRRQREMMMKTVATTDVAITTAAVPGKQRADSRHARDGRGHAARIGHRRSGRRTRRQLRTDEGRTKSSSITGSRSSVRRTSPPTVPYHASQMYARNVVTLVQHLVQRDKGADGKPTGAPHVVLDMDDAITKEIVVTMNGEIVNARVREPLGVS